MPENEPKTTVLVVEDEILVRMYGSDVLGDAGFEVLEAADADEALAILIQHAEIELLFSDIDMPGSMDGLSLAHLVQERWPAIRLLLTSGHHNLKPESMPAKGRFLRKPWTEQILVNNVCAFFNA